MNKRYQLTRHRAWLETSADGNHYVVVEYDGPGAETFLSRLADSTHPFDRWFRTEIAHAHGIDFRDLPDVKSLESVLDSRGPP
jgi:hypothetical protein